MGGLTYSVCSKYKGVRWGRDDELHEREVRRASVGKSGGNTCVRGGCRKPEPSAREYSTLVGKNNRGAVFEVKVLSRSQK